LRYLPKTKGGLWVAFFIFVCLTAVFGLVMTIWEFQIIDEMWRADAIRAHVADMSQTQRHVHAVMTATLDVAYPLSYAAFFGGLTWAGFPNRAWLLLPIFLCVPVDLLEGLSQVMILIGHEDWIVVKVIATPVKLILFVSGVLIGLAGLVRVFMSSRGQRS
jgi:hypothetical protein